MNSSRISGNSVELWASRPEKRQSPCTSTTWLPQGALKARVPRLEMAPPRAFNLMINRWINQMGTLSHRIHVWYIYANIGGIWMVNVTIYSIHGSYGNEWCPKWFRNGPHWIAIEKSVGLRSGRWSCIVPYVPLSARVYPSSRMWYPMVPVTSVWNWMGYFFWKITENFPEGMAL